MASPFDDHVLWLIRSGLSRTELCLRLAEAEDKIKDLEGRSRAPDTPSDAAAPQPGP